MFQEVQSGPWSLRRRQTEAGVVERQHLTLDRQKGNKIWRSWPGVKPRIADSHQAGLYIQAQWELTGLAMGFQEGMDSLNEGRGLVGWGGVVFPESQIKP